MCRNSCTSAAERFGAGVAFLARGVLMSSNNRRINHHPLQIRFLQHLEDAFPNALAQKFLRICPAIEALENRVPLAVALGQVPPRGTGAADPEHRVDKKAIFGRCLAGVFGLAGQKRLNASPLVITNGVASHGHRQFNEKSSLPLA